MGTRVENLEQRIESVARHATTYIDEYGRCESYYLRRGGTFAGKGLNGNGKKQTTSVE